MNRREFLWLIGLLIVAYFVLDLVTDVSLANEPRPKIVRDGKL